VPTLTPIARKFVLHWGEMGDCWGVNRSVAQVHALLYVLGEALSAEDIANLLSMARSNVSTSLKELQAWGIIRVVHKLGDRRDHYESMTDVWEMFRIVLAERHKREVQPTIRILREFEAELKAGAKGEPEGLPERVHAMLEFLEATEAWYLSIRKLPAGPLMKMFKAGGKLQKVFAGT
jgi:DNA-binding transcriptional regulator GbsR (MarR family)